MPINHSLKAKIEPLPEPNPIEEVKVASLEELIEPNLEDDAQFFTDEVDKDEGPTDLENLDNVLQRCEEKHLVLNWEKYHFMVGEGIVLEYLVSERGIEVDRAKIEVIEQLPPPVNIKGIQSFLGHCGFSSRFVKDFSHIARPLTNLLAKDVPFEFDDA
jgi:hypothetical protein